MHLPSLESYKEAVKEVPDQAVGHGLGLASIAVGLTELTMPHKIENLMGIGNHEHTGVIRMLGVRELMHGVDLLTHRDATPGVWSRVAGDALDGVCLAAAARQTRRPGGFLTAVALVLPLVVLDLVFAPRLTRRKAREAAASWWR